MIIETSKKFAEAVVYAFVNMCTSLRLRRSDVTDIINAVILGDHPKTPLKIKIQESDITRQAADQTKYIY